MGRGFEVLPDYPGVAKPRRQTAAAAGYDLAAAAAVVIAPGAVALVPTGLRAVMPPDEFLAIYVRSSLAAGRGVVLANGVGVVDADYAHNPDNGGHILVALRNLGPQPVRIQRGERVAQGIFTRYAVADLDVPGGARQGGFGSTGDGR